MIVLFGNKTSIKNNYLADYGKLRTKIIRNKPLSASKETPARFNYSIMRDGKKTSLILMQ